MSGSFPPTLRYRKRKIHTGFLRFRYLDWTKNLSFTVLADLIRASLALHLPAEKSGDGLHELLLGLVERGRAVLGQKQHAAHQIALGHNGRRRADAVAVGRIRRPDGQIAVLIAIAAPQTYAHLAFSKQIRWVSSHI